MKTDLSSPVATAEFSKFAAIFSAALSQEIKVKLVLMWNMGFCCGSAGKESTCNAEDLG